MKCNQIHCRFEGEFHCFHGNFCAGHFELHHAQIEKDWRDMWAEAKRVQSELMSR